MTDNSLKDYLDIAVDLIVIGESLVKIGNTILNKSHKKPRPRKKKKPRKQHH